MDEMILTYVPESEYLGFDEALALAEKRDEQAADGFMQSVPDSEKLSGPVLVTQMPEEEREFLRQGPEYLKILEPPPDPRKVWGKI